MTFRPVLAAAALVLASKASAADEVIPVTIPERDLIGCTALTASLSDSGILKGEDQQRLANLQAQWFVVYAYAMAQARADWSAQVQRAGAAYSAALSSDPARPVDQRQLMLDAVNADFARCEAIRAQNASTFAALVSAYLAASSAKP